MYIIEIRCHPRDVVRLAGLLLMAAFAWIFAYSGGFGAIADYIEIIPYLLIGGVCSDSLMMRLNSAGLHLGLTALGLVLYLAADIRQAAGLRQLRSVRWFRAPLASA